MKLIRVDEHLCIACGLCARICPVRIIKLSDDSGFPYPGTEAEKMCINCGRCIDKCPTQALYHRYRKQGKKRGAPLQTGTAGTTNPKPDVQG